MGIISRKDIIEFKESVQQLRDVLPLIKEVDHDSYEIIMYELKRLLPNPVIYGVDLTRIKIEKVIFNDPATIVFWSDGTKTTVKCQPNDTYSKETGLAMCIAKKFLGNKGNFNETFKKYIEGYDPRESKEV